MDIVLLCGAMELLIGDPFLALALLSWPFGEHYQGDKSSKHKTIPSGPLVTPGKPKAILSYASVAPAIIGKTWKQL
jgi:hypothetical protein